MPITRTPIIDDDGTGTTGTAIDNAWKQEFYNQIDAVTGGTYGFWVPADISGAGLTFSAVSAWHGVIGRVQFFWVALTYPATSSTANAWISGLPGTCVATGGAATQGFGVQRTWRIYDSPVSILAYVPSSGAAVRNVDLSGASLILSGTYLNT